MPVRTTRQLSRKGLVTIPMAIVGDPGNLSVRVIQYNFLRDWRYYHGGVANASAYQLEISAFDYNSGDPAAQIPIGAALA
jgi:hypothetical protein